MATFGQNERENKTKLAKDNNKKKYSKDYKSNCKIIPGHFHGDPFLVKVAPELLEEENQKGFWIVHLVCFSTIQLHQ